MTIEDIANLVQSESVKKRDFYKRKMQNKYRLFLIVVVVIIYNYSCDGIGYSKAPCDMTYFYDDNKKNDTGKIIYKTRVIFDTTANRLNGTVVDSSSNEPLSDVRVSIYDGSQNFIDTTDINGNFSFFKNHFMGAWQLSINGPSNYKCLLVKNIIIGGGLQVKIKLARWLQN